MTHVPASSHGSTFEGGTITEGLAIADPDPAETDLTVSGAVGQATDVVRFNPEGVAVTDTFIRITEHGQVFVQSGGAFQQATLDLTDTTVGNPGHMLLDTFAGALLSPESSGNTILSLAPRSAHTGPVLEAKNITGAVVTAIPIAGGIKTAVITSGALPTVAPVSGAAFQCSTARDVFLTVPVTYNPGVATTATCKVELSPDNITFSELVTITQPVGTVFDGSIEAVQLVVPAAWRVKLTVVNATLGTGTYY